MTDVQEIKRMLADHMGASTDNHLKVMVQLTKLETNEKTNYKTITANSKSIKDLEDTDNKRKGILWVLGILWVGVVAIVGWILHK